MRHTVSLENILEKLTEMGG